MKLLLLGCLLALPAFADPYYVANDLSPTTMADTAYCAQMTGGFIVEDPNCVSRARIQSIQTRFHRECVNKRNYVTISFFGFVMGKTQEENIDNERCDLYADTIAEDLIRTSGGKFDPVEFNTFVRGYKAAEHQNHYRAASNKELYTRWVMHKLIQNTDTK